MTNVPSILRSLIPAGGFGRELTSTEIRAARRAFPGTPVSNAAIVVQDCADYRGIIYNPQQGGGYSHSGIVVQISAACEREEEETARLAARFSGLPHPDDNDLPRLRY